jgi:hypothetical protein
MVTFTKASKQSKCIKHVTALYVHKRNSSTSNTEKESVPTSQKTHHSSIKETSSLSLSKSLKHVIALYVHKHNSSNI